MRLAELSVQHKDELANQYRDRGIVVLHQVDLPDTFSAARSDFIFLKLPNGCEVYFSAAIEYTGSSRTWQLVCEGESFPGNARQVVVTPGDVFTGLQVVARQLEEAGGTYPSWAPARGRSENGSVAAEPARDEVAAVTAADMHRPVMVAATALFDELQHEVRGQNHVLRTLSRRLSRHLARREPRRPATFFAVGPTGVGKTSTAEALRSALGRLLPAADGLGYVRIDASELAEEHRVSQLVGAPPGYVGYQDGAELIDTLMITPRALVVFDEIEKAHPVVLRVLLNLLDAGRLSSPDRSRQRQTIDARQAVLFFTTNLRSEAILEELATRQALGDAGTVDAVCRRHLRRAGLAPELVGRIGSFLAFSPLSPAARAEIIELAIARVAGEYGLQIASVSRSVIEGILAESITSDLGARPDEYLVDELLGDAFMAAASQAGQGRWRVTGPPFQCEPTE